MKRIANVFILTCVIALTASMALADATYQTIPFAQDWTDINLITVNNDWSMVPGIIGYRGDDPAGTVTGVDPQTILLDDPLLVINAIANQLAPNTLTTGGVAEFEITNPVVALNGSGTADWPYLQLHLNTLNWATVTVSFNLRDIDGSTDNSIQQIALQYRIGTTGTWTNLPAGYVADASSGPSLDTLVTPVSVVLPSVCDDQAQVQVRVITTNAISNDEWIGIDDITVTSQSVATESSTWGAVKTLFN
jgi:uncharacterized protein